MSESSYDFSDSPLHEERIDGRRNRGVFRFLTAIFLVLCLIVVLFAVYFRAAYSRVVVDGESMMQTLSDGDVLYVNRNKKAERGDIVVLDVKQYAQQYAFSGDYIIKRLIATEGDSLFCADDIVYIRYANAAEYVPLEENYVYLETERRRSDFPEITVGTGQIFVLGDNRRNSYDSGEVGCFETEDIYGVVPGWAYGLRGFFTSLYNVWG